MIEFEHTGLWWIPWQKENKISGILTIENQDEIQLKLIGAFADISSGLSQAIGSTDLTETYPLLMG